MAVLELTVATGDALSVRRFEAREAISEPFDVSIVARSPDPSLDLDAIVGKPASFRIMTGMAGAAHTERRWEGICRFAAQDQAEPSGLSTYHFRLAPALWLMTQRRDHRIIQHRSALRIATGLLDLWRIEHALAVDAAAHPPLPYKVQYGESDYAFFCRILEEAGIAFTFPETLAGQGTLTLSDRLESGTPRPGAVAYEPVPNEAAEREFVTDVRIADRSRPGAYAIRDHDLRRPAYRLLAEAERAPAPEAAREQYHYRPGAFLVDTAPSGDTPAADDEGAARHDDEAGRRRAQRSLEGERADKVVVSYRTNILDLWPGRIFAVADHPHPALGAGKRLLARELSLEGAPGEEWIIRGQAVLADAPYRPPARMPRPRARIQSATVVGPGGEEIHTDELGRARILFPWDRHAENTCWARVSQAWAGAGYGMMALPRIGQEVLVDFLDGDPEQPVIVGRVFNQTNPVIERLPAHATRSAWKSNSSPASAGFNELLFEDRKGSELYYEQAEKDARRLVKHDETITVGHDRKRTVVDDDVETTLRNRVQETKRDRVELTYGDRTTEVDGTRRERVGRDAVERIETEQAVWVGKDLHVITGGTRRESVEQDGHLYVGRNRPESVGGADSLAVHEGVEESVGSYSVDASGEQGWIHIYSGSKIHIESSSDVALLGGGSFVDVTGNVVAEGPEVLINESGSPGDLFGAEARLPEPAREARVDEPPPPREPKPSDPTVVYELVVFDEWEEPIAGLEFAVTTPAGTRTETTDREGRIRVEGPPEKASAFVRKPEDLGGLVSGKEKKARRTAPLPKGDPWHVRTPTDVSRTVILPHGEPQKMMIVTRTDLTHHAFGSLWTGYALAEAGPCEMKSAEPLRVQMLSDATGAQAVVVGQRVTAPGGPTSTEKSTGEEAGGAERPSEWLRTVVDSLHDGLVTASFDAVFSILASIPHDPPEPPRPTLPEPTAEEAAYRVAIEGLAREGVTDPPYEEDPNQP